MCPTANTASESRHGYSLIELLAVLAIMSLTTAAVTIRWSDVYRGARFEADTEKVIAFDFKARRHATARNKPCRITYDLGNQTIRASRWVEGQEKQIKTSLLAPNRITEVIQVRSRQTSGTIELQLSGTGATPTYAVAITNGSQQTWILFAGRTGQTHVVSESKSIETMFESLLGDRIDSD